MENHRKSSHCTYDIKYPIVWLTKYRKPVIIGQLAIRMRELIRRICQINDVQILVGHVGKDHIHLFVSVPPHLSASKLVQYLKGIHPENRRWNIKNGISSSRDSIYGREGIPRQVVEM